MVEENVNFDVSKMSSFSSSENELEESVIPNSENTPDDDELDDVIPCEPVVFEKEEMIHNEFIDFSNDGFYDNSGYTPSTSVEQMVDIPSNGVKTSEYELDEVEIFYSEDDSDNEELEDIVFM